MFGNKFRGTCNYCGTGTNYVANVNDRFLYFCKLGGCKEKYLDARRINEAHLKQPTPGIVKGNSIEFKGFKITETSMLRSGRYCIVLKSEDKDGWLIGSLQFFLNDKNVKDFTLGDEYEVTITKKVK